MKMIERILLTMVAVATLFTSTIRVDAAAREDIIEKRFRKMIYTEFNEAYNDWKAKKAEGDEEMSLIKSMAMTYDEVGINVYHVNLKVTMEDETVIDGHVFYDAVDDDWFAEYYQIGEERYSSDEFEKIYPDYPLL